jgi:hypothetical protein
VEWGVDTNTMRIVSDYCFIPFYAPFAFVNIIASRPNSIAALPSGMVQI